MDHIQEAIQHLQGAVTYHPMVKRIVDFLETLQLNEPTGQAVSQSNDQLANQLNNKPTNCTTVEARLGTLERKIDTVVATVAALATQRPQHTTHRTKSYAAAAAAATATTPLVQPQASRPSYTQLSQPPQPHPQRPSKENRLVIILRKGATTPALDPLTLRNSINTFIKATKGLQNVVSTISLSLKGNITITTPGHIAVDIIDQSVIRKVFEGYPIDRVQAPETWIQLVAHGAPKRPFEGPEGMDIFKEEIHIFNSCKVVNNPRWLVAPGAAKQAGSVVFAVATEAEGRACIVHGVVVAGVLLRVARLRPYGPTTQCFRCQGFGHNPKECREPPRCRFDGEAHHTTQHTCKTCKAQAPCQHTVLHCANCQGAHQANSTTCDVYKGLH